jgi:hypothetical protein
MPADKDPLVGLDEIARLLEEHEGPPETRRRHAPHASRSGLRLTGTVAAGALVVGSALGFGLGTLTPSGNAASAAGVGFVPSSGWRVLQSGGDATPLRPALAIASNMRLDPEDDARGIRTASGLPYATLLGLPRQGIVIVATFTVPNADTPDPSYPRTSLPLELRDASPIGQNSTQIRPARPLGEYELRAHVNHRDVLVHFYFGRSQPTDAMLTEAQRQLDGLVVAPTRNIAQVAQRALPDRPEASTAPTVSAAPSGATAKVIDRTLTCTTGFGKGVRNVELLARSAFRNPNGKLDGLGQVVVATPGNPIPNRPQTFAPTLAGATAGWPAPPPFQSGALGFSPRLCKPARATVRLSSRGFPAGGEASVFGEDVTCPTPNKVFIRVRATFFTPAALVLSDKKDYLSADARIKRAQIAVRTPDGKPIAYGEVLDSGKATLFTAGRCV